MKLRRSLVGFGRGGSGTGGFFDSCHGAVGLQGGIPPVAGVGPPTPWGQAGKMWAELVKSVPRAASTSSCIRGFRDPGRPDTRVLALRQGVIDMAVGLDHQLVAAGKGTQPVFAAIFDARLCRN